MPTIGMMRPGHYLLATRAHYLSFGQLADRTALRAVHDQLTAVAGHLAQWFGSYVLVEHGSASVPTVRLGSRACIEHAHIHLLPDPGDTVGSHLQTQLNWQELAGFEDLESYAGGSYMYLGRLGLHAAVADPEVPSQWLRREVAAVLGTDMFDWALAYPEYEENLRATFAALSAPAAL